MGDGVELLSKRTVIEHQVPQLGTIDAAIAQANSIAKLFPDLGVRRLPWLDNEARKFIQVDDGKLMMRAQSRGDGGFTACDGARQPNNVHQQNQGKEGNVL